MKKSIIVLGLFLATTLAAQTAKAPIVDKDIALQIRTAQLQEAQLQNQQLQLVQQYKNLAESINTQETALNKLKIDAYKAANLSEVDYTLDMNTLQFTKKPVTKTTK